jgi:hypothetical protein
VNRSKTNDLRAAEREGRGISGDGRCLVPGHALNVRPEVQMVQWGQPGIRRGRSVPAACRSERLGEAGGCTQEGRGGNSPRQRTGRAHRWQSRSLCRKDRPSLEQWEAQIPGRGRSSSRGLSLLRLTRGPMGKKTDELSCREVGSSTRPDGISIHNDSTGRAPRRQNPPTRRPRRPMPHRSSPVQKAARPQA